MTRNPYGLTTGHHVAAALALAALLYLGAAFSVFKWRNPTANDAACWREFPAVLRFEALPRYQPRP